eukprot:TRINITY_DN30_c0_g2_i1.p1 TRINITY_DN30_c0_g2~~TRINITY_DN30_c0_g2_i1.p1  ORF type:complete len:203 (-),score=15.11 TRINITY_DN30_c0_g2_i1:91-699(-)
MKTTLFKVMIVGDRESGKSALLQRFTEQKTSEGKDQSDMFKIKILPVDSENIKMQLWDVNSTAMTSTYYQQAQAVMVVFSLELLDTYNSLLDWVNQIKAWNCRSNTVTALVGNSSSFQNRAVTTEEANRFAQENGFSVYCEVNTMTGESVQEVFENMVRHHRSILNVDRSSPRKSVSEREDITDEEEEILPRQGQGCECVIL